jgi:hypothetical protein
VNWKFWRKTPQEPAETPEETQALWIALHQSRNGDGRLYDAYMVECYTRQSLILADKPAPMKPASYWLLEFT